MSSDNSEDEANPPSPLRLPAYLEGSTDYQTLHERELKLVEEETQRRIKCLLEGSGELSKLDPQTFSDPEILRRLTSSVSSALDEAASALNKIRSEAVTKGDLSTETNISSNSVQIEDSSRLLAEACSQGDWLTVQQLLSQGRSIHEPGEDGESLLSLACSAGYYELVEVLLKMRSGMEDKGMKDCTPLMESASGGYSDIVKLLLDHGVDVNAKSAAGNTALTYACCGGHEEVVKILLDGGANMEEPNENGHTPLMEAASGGHISVAKLLLGYGANINTHSVEFKESALTLSCYKGHLDMVRFLLSAGADQEHKTDEMHTALMEASMDGHVDVARLLLDHGAQVNMPADSFESPLTLAACGGHQELAALLISRGADLEEVNDEGYTPLMEAAREGHDDVITLLVENGANVNSQTEETQETALTLACCGGFIQPVKYLISKGADIEQGASTPLMEAAQEGHYYVVSYLLDRGANIQATSTALETALTCAAGNGHRKVCELLLSRGAHLEHKSEGGRTPLMKAARAGHLDTVKFLVERGANVNRSTTSRDHTVLSLACAGGHIGVVQYLLMKGADPSCLLKDNSTILIEAAKGGHTHIACLLLKEDFRTQANITSNPSNVGPSSINPESISSAGLPSSVNMSSVARSTVPIAVRGDHSVEGDPPALVGDPPILVGDPSDVREGPSGVRGDPSDVREGPLGVKEGPLGVRGDPSGVPSLQQQALLRASQAGLLEGVLQRMSTPPVNQEGLTKPIDGLSNRLTTPLAHRDGLSRPLISPSNNQEGSSPSNQMGMSPNNQVGVSPNNQVGVLLSNQTDKSPPGKKANVSPSNHMGASPTSSQSGVSPSNQVGVSPPSNQESMSHPLPTPIATQPWDPIEANFNFGKPPPTVAVEMAMAPVGMSPRRFHGRPPPQTPGHLPKVSRKRAAPPEDITSEDSSNEELPYPCQPQRQDPIGQSSPQVYAQGPSLRLPSNSYLNDFDNPRLPDFLPPRNRGLLKSLSGTGLRRAFSMEAIPSELMYGSEVRENTHAYQSTATQIFNQLVPVEGPLGSVAMATKQEILQFQEMLFQRVQHTQGQAVVGQDYRYYGYHNEDDFDDGGEGDDEDDGEDDMDQQDPCFRGHDRLYPPPRTLRSLGASIPVDAQTDSNHDTALTLAAQGGYDKLVQLLLSHSADIEHKDKKGCTPLILAASAGHVVTVTVLLEHGANIEAVSDRTKDTALSLACSGGRQEVVDLLLQKKANFEHRNVSDYTPLSLAASGGYVSIMKALLRMGADVNSRTGSKLGITPLMLASMNGHTQAVKLLLDHGADINAQIETNKNTALTLACFQGRQEVVSLLCMRGGNVEHRAKTGLTPLMEAASGGYHEVGRVLVEHGADLNAPPVPSSKDTALTIAADKGHVKFVDMILKYGANVDVKNKKGNSPLWLACNGGHFEVVRCLLKAKSDPDSQDNRKVSCLTAAFRKGHVKVVKCLVDYVSQFPSDGDCRRFVSTITDKDHMKRSIQCLELISQAKERQEAEANKNASILLQELDMEKQNEEQKKMAAAKKRERKKRQKEKKKAKASEDVGKQEDNQDDDLTQECPPSSDALHLLPSSQLISAVTTTLTTTVAMVTTAVPLTATAVTTPSNKKTLATTNVTKTTRNVNISPKTIVLETTPTVSVTMATTRVKQPVKTTIVTTATIAVTTVVTSNSIASTTSPRKSRKEDTPVSTAGWREVHKKAKTTPRRSQSLRKEIAAKDMSSRESFLQDSMPRDVHHHPVDTYRDVMRERITTRVPLTPTTATSSTKTKPVSYQATAIKTSASLSSKGERSTKGKIPTSITESATQQVAKATVASYDNTFVSVSKDHAPLQTRPQLYKGAKVTSADKTVVMATRSTSGTTSVSVKSSVLGKGASPPKTVASMPTPAVTSVTMTTKHPISSVSKQPSGSVLPKMGMVTSSKKTQSSTRTSQSLASKGVSYSAIVGGAKVKEDLSSPPLNILSIATSTSDGTYQPFGPVVDSSSDHKPVPTPPGSGSPWRAPTAAKTSPSSKPAVTTPDDKQTTPKLSPSNNTGSNLSITIDTEVSGRHLGPIGPPSYNEKSPPTPLNDRSSLTHSPHTADEPQSPLTPSDYVVRETPSTTSSLPLLPTPIGPPTGPPTAPPAALPTILRPSEFPLKSPMVPGMPVGGAHPAYQPTRGPRPPLLPHPIFSQNQQPMAYYPMVEPHMVYGPEVTSPFGSSGEPPKGAILEGVGIVRNMGSGFNPNATPFIPSYLHGMSPTPHTNVMGMSPTPHTNVMGVAPEVIQPQRPYPVQMMYQHQYNLPQDGVLKVAGPPGPPAPGPPAPGPPTPGPPTAGPPAPGPTGPVQGGEGDWGKMHHQRVIPVHQSVVQNPQGPTPHLHSTAVTIVTPQPVPSPQIGYPIMLPGQQMQPEVSITMTTTSAASMKILDHLPPIGTERAHKRSSSYGNPIQFSTALYGKEDVWSFSEASSSTPFVWGTTSASVTMATTSESTIITTSEDHSDSFHDNSSSSKFVITSADTIDSVLTRLSLSDHLPVFKSNEIDLNALLLMTDKDYSELGIKEVPRLKLLTAIGNQSHNTSEDNPVRSEEAWLEETQVSASASNSQ